MTAPAASAEPGRRARGKRVALALALAAGAIGAAALVLLRHEVAALWYEHRLDHGPEAQRAGAVRRLAATRADRALRRVVRVLLEEPMSEPQQTPAQTQIPIKGLISVDSPGLAAAAQQALIDVGVDALPAATEAIERVAASGDPERIEHAARRLAPVLIPLGHLEDWTGAVTDRWMGRLKYANGKAASAAGKLQELGIASLPALLKGLDSDEWFLARWSESILWKLAKESPPACRGLLHAYAQAGERVRQKLMRVFENATPEGQAFLLAAAGSRDPALARAARELLDRIAATAPPPRG